MSEVAPMLTIEAVASYQRMGDGPAVDWAEAVLEHAERTGVILPGWQVFGEWQASWVQVVVFTYRFGTTNTDTRVVTSLAVNLAASIVGEFDVAMLGLKVIEAPGVNTSDSSRTDGAGS